MAKEKKSQILSCQQATGNFWFFFRGAYGNFATFMHQAQERPTSFWIPSQR